MVITFIKLHQSEIQISITYKREDEIVGRSRMLRDAYGPLSSITLRTSWLGTSTLWTRKVQLLNLASGPAIYYNRPPHRVSMDYQKRYEQTK